MIYLLSANLDIKNEKDEIHSLRFQTAVKAIKKLLGRNNKVVVLSHHGRPKGFEKKLSLKPLEKLFERELKRDVIFFKDFNFNKMRVTIKEAKPGTIFLLENLRFLDGETKNSLKLGKELASLGDVFVNDDFATAHRKNASNFAITKFIKSKMGDTLKSEVVNLGKAIKKPKHPFVLIIGGAKMADKMGVINNLLPKIDHLLLGGGPANTFLRAAGFEIENSIYEPEMLHASKRLLKNKKIVMPIDWVKENSRILDIGKDTVKLFSTIISKAKLIIWSGPMGFFEDEKFTKGSDDIARAVVKSRGFCIIGGGDTTRVIDKLKISKNIGFVSTGGGAMLDFLAGKRMPAILALNKNAKIKA